MVWQGQVWSGAFSPGLAKHRDWLHATFMAHILATGGAIEVGDSVRVDRNPITEEPFEDPIEYFQVTVRLHDGSEYVFLIVSNTPGAPSEEEIEEQLTEYIKNPVPGGRNIEDYIAIDVDEITTDQATEQEFDGQFTTRELGAA